MQYIFTHMFVRPELDWDGKKVFRYYPDERTTHNILDAIDHLAECLDTYTLNREYAHTVVSCAPDNSDEKIEVRQINLAKAAHIHAQRVKADDANEIFHRIDTNDFYFGGRF